MVLIPNSPLPHEKGQESFPHKISQTRRGDMGHVRGCAPNALWHRASSKIYLCYTVAGDSDDILLARRDLSENTTKDEYIRFTV